MPTSTLTLTALRTAMRYRLGDPNAVYWSDAFLARCIKRAVLDYTTENLVVWKSASITTLYPLSSLPADFFRLDFLKYLDRELHPGYGAEFRSNNLDASLRGAPTIYVLESNRGIRFHPYPVDGTTIDIWYYATEEADPVTGKFELPDYAVLEAMERAYAYAYEKEGESQSIRLAGKYHERFGESVEQMAARIGSVTKDRTPVMGGLSPDPVSFLARPQLPPEFGQVVRRPGTWRG